MDGSVWSCEPKSQDNCYTVFQYVQKIKGDVPFKVNNGRPSYCYVMRDDILPILSGVSDLLASNISISAATKDSFLNYINLLTDLIKERSKTTVNNGYMLDEGSWKDHESSTVETITDVICEPVYSVDNTISLDLSHTRKWVHLFEGLYRNKNCYGQTFPDLAIMEQFSNQFAYNIFNGNYEYPLFSNYFSGANRWHRYNYKHKQDPDNYPGKDGYAPYFYSMSAMEGGYTFLSTYNSNINSIRTSLYNMVQEYNYGNDSGTKDLVDKYYGSWYSSCNVLSKGQLNFYNPATSKNLLQFYPTFFPNTNKEVEPLTDVGNRNFLYINDQQNIIKYNNCINTFNKVSSGWNNYTRFLVGNWSNNGTDDLIAYHEPTKELHLYKYKPDGSGFYANYIVVGAGWSNYTEFLVGNWTKNKDTDDLIAYHEPTKQLHLYKYNPNENRFYAGYSIVSKGWSNYTEFLVGNWTLKDTDDLIAYHEPTKQLHLYKYNPDTNRFYSGYSVVSAGWSNYTKFMVGNWTDSNSDDLIAYHEPLKKLHLYKFKMTNDSFYSEIKTVKTDIDLNTIQDFYVNDINNNGMNDLLTIDSNNQLQLLVKDGNINMDTKLIGKIPDYGKLINGKWENKSNQIKSINISIRNRYNDNLKIENDFKVYPNPMSKQLYFESLEGFDSIEIYNIIGEKIHSAKWNYKIFNYQWKTPINTSKGIYFYQIKNKGKVMKSGKIIKKSSS
ncbi:T9SS type A sorting domain-containing protein [Aquimarina aggregata]|uniref:T9SS type A sorting domain-containing protein n=1 Tax=Aquimarina aggregata TaxID=1642818 RepID=UPI00248F944B|nr:T9SS type A sorting domain-containing protein [Aquimarina aggregata]